jgi:hypothetical protein
VYVCVMYILSQAEGEAQKLSDKVVAMGKGRERAVDEEIAEMERRHRAEKDRLVQVGTGGY